MTSYCVNARAPAVVVLVVNDHLDELAHHLGQLGRVRVHLLAIDERRSPTPLLRLVHLHINVHLTFVRYSNQTLADVIRGFSTHVLVDLDWRVVVLVASLSFPRLFLHFEIFFHFVQIPVFDRLRDDKKSP